MTGTETEPFSGITIAHPTKTFEVACHELKLARRWLRSSSFEDNPEFSSSVHGRAVAERDHVTVFDYKQCRTKEFHLTLRTDARIRQSWESMKGIELLVKELNGERRRIRDLQHERFDKSPPTATVFYHQGHWAMECEVQATVLDRLSLDLIAGCVDMVNLRIDWPFGLIAKQTGDWGFFADDQLRGYVSSVTWLLRTERNPRN